VVATAKIFMNGASQAIRLPREFRLKGNEVCIKRVGSGILLFHKKDAWRLFSNALGKADPDFMADRKQPKRAEKRRSL